MDAFSFDASSGCLTVCGEFTVYQAKQAKAALERATADGRLIYLNLEAVTEFDSSAVQLLLCAQPMATVTDASEVVRRVVKLMNLENQLLPLQGEAS